MEISIKGKVNDNVIDAITLLTTNKYRNVPMFIGGIGSDGFPTIGVAFNGADCSERVKMEDIYTEAIEEAYELNGEDLYTSEPTYEGLVIVDENEIDKKFFKDKTLFGFYVLDGVFYDDINDVKESK